VRRLPRATPQGSMSLRPTLPPSRPRSALKAGESAHVATTAARRSDSCYWERVLVFSSSSLRNLMRSCAIRRHVWS